MKLKVFYHVVDLPNWQVVADEQLSKIKNSGLLDICELNINLHYNENSFTELKQQWAHPNIVWHFNGRDHREMEHSTFILMQQTALNSNEDFYCLYLHMKGVTHMDKPWGKNTTAWRRYLEFFNIVNWRACVDKLNQGWDTCGTELQLWYWGDPVYWGTAEQKRYDNRYYYTGNICWYNSKFLKAGRPILRYPSEVDFKAQLPGPYQHEQEHYRNDVEFWAGNNGMRAYNFMHSGKNLYHEVVEERDYINFFKE
jgi:hypothetical protein